LSGQINIGKVNYQTIKVKLS